MKHTSHGSCMSNWLPYCCILPNMCLCYVLIVILECTKVTGDLASLLFNTVIDERSVVTQTDDEVQTHKQTKKNDLIHCEVVSMSRKRGIGVQVITQFMKPNETAIVAQKYPAKRAIIVGLFPLAVTYTGTRFEELLGSVAFGPVELVLLDDLHRRCRWDLGRVHVKKGTAGQRWVDCHGCRGKAHPQGPQREGKVLFGQLVRVGVVGVDVVEDAAVGHHPVQCLQEDGGDVPLVRLAVMFVTDNVTVAELKGDW